MNGWMNKLHGGESLHWQSGKEPLDKPVRKLIGTRVCGNGKICCSGGTRSRGPLSSMTELLLSLFIEISGARRRGGNGRKVVGGLSLNGKIKQIYTEIVLV